MTVIFIWQLKMHVLEDNTPSSRPKPLISIKI